MTFPEANTGYPYDGTDTKFLDGLEKLRGIEDPKLRELVWEAFEERDRRSRGQQWSAPEAPRPETHAGVARVPRRRKRLEVPMTRDDTYSSGSRNRDDAGRVTPRCWKGRRGNPCRVRGSSRLQGSPENASDACATPDTPDGASPQETSRQGAADSSKEPRE